MGGFSNPVKKALFNVSFWRRLANQTHWHLTLLGAGNEVADFFEFENCFDLASALDAMEEGCRGIRVTDFMRAKQQFWEHYSMDDLYAMSPAKHHTPGRSFG